MENGAFAPKEQMLHFPYFQIHDITKVLLWSNRFSTNDNWLWSGNIHIRTTFYAYVQETPRPKLKFYLFPITRPTLKKSPCSKNFISIFSQEFFFHCKLRELSNVNSVIFANCLCIYFNCL